jgi:hypothetical protein
MSVVMGQGVAGVLRENERGGCDSEVSAEIVDIVK